MNKKGIPSLNFLLGLVLGIFAVVMGVLFLYRIYGNLDTGTYSNSYEELRAKIMKIEDGRSFVMSYKPSKNDFVIGFDKDQKEAKFVFSGEDVTSESTTIVVPITIAMIPVFIVGERTKTLIIEKPPNCGGGKNACLCRWNNVEGIIGETRNCANLEGIEKVEGPHFIGIVTESKVLKTDEYKTFFIPETEGKNIILNVRKEGKTIFINS